MTEINMYTKKLTALILFFNSFVIGQTQGQLVPNGITIGNDFPGHGTQVKVLQDPGFGNYTGFFLVPQTRTTFTFEPLLDEGVRTFRVPFNAPITESFILSGSYEELSYPNTYSFANLSVFYLGFYTGDSFPVNGVYSDPLFGWGKFQNIGGTISLLDSALVYGAGGIIAGTQTFIPVPEPGVWALLTLGGVLSGCAALRRRR